MMSEPNTLVDVVTNIRRFSDELKSVMRNIELQLGEAGVQKNTGSPLSGPISPGIVSDAQDIIFVLADALYIARSIESTIGERRAESGPYFFEPSSGHNDPRLLKVSPKPLDEIEKYIQSSGGTQ